MLLIHKILSLRENLVLCNFYTLLLKENISIFTFLQVITRYLLAGSVIGPGGFSFVSEMVQECYFCIYAGPVLSPPHPSFLVDLVKSYEEDLMHSYNSLIARFGQNNSKIIVLLLQLTK